MMFDNENVAKEQSAAAATCLGTWQGSLAEEQKQVEKLAEQLQTRKNQLKEKMKNIEKVYFALEMKLEQQRSSSGCDDVTTALESSSSEETAQEHM